jgi:hypothetical protein
VPNAGIMASAVHIVGGGGNGVGPCNEILFEPFDNMNAWRLGNASIVSGGLNGTCLLLPNGGGSLVFDIPSAARSETMTVAFAFRTSIIGIQAPLIEFRADSSGVRHAMLTIEADNSFKWWKGVAPGGTTLLTSAAGLVAVNQWYYVKMQYKIDDVNGSVTVLLNDTIIMSGVGLDTRNGGVDTTISMIYLTNITGPSPNTNIDNLHLTTGTGCPSNCTLVLKEPFDTLNNWTNSGCTIVSGRTGTAAQSSGFTEAVYTIPANSESSVITIGASVKINSLSGIVSVFDFLTDNRTYPAGRLVANPNGSLAVTNSAITIVSPSSAAGIISVGVWYYIEVQYIMATSPNGSAKVRLNGVEVLSASGFNSRATKATYDGLKIPVPLGSGGGTNQYDDLYISTGSGCPFKGWQTIGSCNAVLTEPFDNFTSAPWTLSGSPVITGGRTGTGAQFDGTTHVASYTIPTDKQSDTITMGFAWKTNSLALPATNIAQFNSDSGATQHNQLFVTSGGNIVVSRSGTQLATAAHGMVANTWYYLEWQVRLHGTTGSAIVRINGVEKINIGNVNTKNAGTKTVYDQVKILGTSGPIENYDDLYIKTGSGCKFEGDPTTCNLLLEDPFDNLTAWTEIGGTPAIVSGRNGTGVEFEGATTDAIFYSISSAVQSNTLTMGFAWKVSDISERVICQFQSEGVVHVELATNASGGFNVRRGSPTGTIIASSSSGLYSINTWYYLEIQTKLHNAAGFATVRLNDSQIINLSGLDTRNGPTKAEFDRIAVGTSHTRIMTVDDLYISTGAGCIFQNDHVPPAPILMEPFNNFSFWTNSGGSISGSGRTGNCARLGSFAQIYHSISAINQSSTMLVGFALKLSVASTVDRQICQFRSDSNVTTHGELHYSGDTDKRLYWIRGTSGSGVTLGQSATNIMSLDTWYYVEVKVFLHDTLGTLEVRLNDTTIINLINQDTKAGGTSTKFDRLFLGTTPNTLDQFYDDLYIKMGPGSTFKGSITI